MLVVAAALIDPKGRVLVQRRKRSSEHGGLWEFPGGKVEPGETLPGALVRELAEELGIAIEPADLAALTFSTRLREDGRELALMLYSCRRWEGVPTALDAEAVAWHAPAGLGALDMPPLDIELARNAIPLLM
ncbi:(deoxy)nucleoside triphosphate pyrophosphohydrolase [Novosphingobium sp. ZN18A2]|uniref:(deoxy)nucleoside triphosphate pyrophosphohydrolase n=1 Tax=Novosphingobium sp. ZN18A2 TaxID=3079861 RepID=UPI0030D57792